MAKETFPLVGSITSRSGQAAEYWYFNPPDWSAAVVDQGFKNGVFDVVTNAVTGRATPCIRAVPQFGASSYPSGVSDNIRAVMLWTGASDAIVSATDATNSTIYSNSSSIGAITGKVKYFSETTISGVANFVATADSNRAWFYPSGGALTEITDGDFPPKQGTPLTITGNFVHMDGFAFIGCTNGQIWNSDLNSLSAWTSTSYVTCSSKPDGLVGIVRYKDLIVGLGKASIDYFYNAGNAVGSPLSRVSSGSANIGCINADSICAFGETVAFIGAPSSGGSIGVYVLDGQSAKKISPAAVDDFITGRDVTTFKMNVIAPYGKFLLFVQEIDGFGILFDPDTKLWTYYQPTIGIKQTALIIANMIGGGSNTRVYTLSAGGTTRVLYMDAANGYEPMYMQIGPMDSGSMDYKTCNEFRLIGDVSSPTSTATAYISYSDNDGTTWSTERAITFASGGSFNNKLTRLGRYRRRFYRIRMPYTGFGSVLPPRLHAVEMDIAA